MTRRTVKRTLELNQHERIIAVVPEICAGPGWSNQPVWVYIQDSQHSRLRTACLQPEQQTREMRQLFGLGALLHTQLVAAVPTVDRCTS